MIRLHQVHIKEKIILHIVHIAVTRMIDAGIDGLYRGKNMGGGDDRSIDLVIFPVGK